MADTFIATNTWMCYIQNQPYIYPNDNSSTMTSDPINTGWHILPNMLWKHFLTPKQWAELVIHYEAYHVEEIKIQVFNMIPMTQQLAIQGTTVFTAFNNCIYAMGYKDDLYETSWENWYRPDNDKNLNLLYKEGQICENGTTNKKRKLLPIYTWSPPNSRARVPSSYENWMRSGGDVTMSAVYPAGQGNTITKNADRPTGVLWDPLNRPNHIQELRPGKNSIGFSWQSHPCDSERWFNLDQIAWWHPYTAEGPYNAAHPRPGTYKLTTETDPDMLASRYEWDPYINDYTIPNWENVPVVPMQWWWKEIQESICPYVTKEKEQRARINQFFVGTESECYKYGPTQMFIKMIPLFDSNGTHISCTANVSVQTELKLSVKKRRSAIYAPTWGPFSWYDLYTAQAVHRRFAPSLIRYRTGGMRRTWQNIGDTENGNYARPRETPFNYKATEATGTGADGTYSTSTAVTYTKATDTVTIQTTSTRTTPSAPPIEEMDSSPPRDPGHIYPPLDILRRVRRV
nr:MAG: hypothetical protein [Chapparvovirus sp.]